MPAHDMPAGQGVPAASAAPREGAMEREQFALWEDRTRISLTPIAAPSILGLFGFAGATMMVGAWQANWYGTALTPLVLFPFVLTFGGLAQFLAGMWSYRARDGLATAMHGMWGAFWIGWGLLFLLVAVGAYPLALAPRIGAVNQSFAFWFIALCVITGAGALAAMGKNLAMSAVLWPLAAGSGFTAAGFWAGSTWPIRVGGWLFVISADDPAAVRVQGRPEHSGTPRQASAGVPLRRAGRQDRSVIPGTPCRAPSPSQGAGARAWNEALPSSRKFYVSARLSWASIHRPLEGAGCDRRFGGHGGGPSRRTSWPARGTTRRSGSSPFPAGCGSATTATRPCSNCTPSASTSASGTPTSDRPSADRRPGSTAGAVIH
jgi:uncharacterized protein